MLTFRTLISDITFVAKDRSENLEINWLLGFGASLYIHIYFNIYDSFKVHSHAPFIIVYLYYLVVSVLYQLSSSLVRNNKRSWSFIITFYNRSFIPYYFSCFYWPYVYWLVKTKGLISFLNIDISLWHLGSNCFFFSSINPTPSLKDRQLWQTLLDGIFNIPGEQEARQPSQS